MIRGARGALKIFISEGNVDLWEGTQLSGGEIL